MSLPSSKAAGPDRIVFTGVDLDRAGDGRRRDADWVEEQLAHPGARCLVLGDAGVAVSGDPPDLSLDLVPLGSAREQHPHASPVLLGIDADGPLWSIDESPPREGERAAMVGAAGRRGEPGAEVQGRAGLRDLATSMSDDDAALAAYAGGLANWHRANRFCSNCGHPTDPAEAGFTRSCSGCRTNHHPRTDPVAIMLVTDGSDRILLGRQASWPAGRYSALAGFVGPGESLEEALAREVEEEAGVEVGDARYIASQPWPFPASLMLGFIVPWISGEPGGTDPELEDVRWFSREEVIGAVERNAHWEPTEPVEGLLLPPRTAIARRLIERWLAADVPGPVLAPPA